MMPGLAFYLLAVPAVILFGLSKGGFSGISVLGTPLIALAVGPTQAAGIVLPILVVQDAVGIMMFRRHWDRRLIVTMLPGAVVGVGLAFLLASHVSQAIVEIVLGAISACFAFVRTPSVQAAEPRSGAIDRGIGLLSGVASGFTSMIAHAGVPPFQFYVMPKRLSRDMYIGTSIVYFAATNYLKILPFALLGQFTATNLFLSGTLFPLALLSTWVGARVVRRVDPTQFYMIIRLLLAFTGIVLVLKGFYGLHLLPVR